MDPEAEVLATAALAGAAPAVAGAAGAAPAAGAEDSMQSSGLVVCPY